MALRHKDVLKNICAQMEYYGRTDVDVYLIGSVRASKGRFFNAQLSDIDLLFLCQGSSIEDYASHFDRIINQVQLADTNDHIIEAFFASPSTVEFYFSCLATIIGDNALKTEDHIFGEAGYLLNGKNTPSLAVRQRLYQARSIYFCNEYSRALPVANTEKARKVAKLLLRGLELVICAYTPTDRLVEMEKNLFSVATFKDLRPFFESTVGLELKVDKVFEEALVGTAIKDWPSWMVAQDKVAHQLLNLGANQQLLLLEARFFETVAGVVHDMLLADLRSILSEKDSKTRKEQIAKYADTTASIIVKIGLSGVTALNDFESSLTPPYVKESYRMLVKHLQGNPPSLSILASSVILLEYSLAQAIEYANLNK